MGRSKASQPAAEGGVNSNLQCRDSGSSRPFDSVRDLKRVTAVSGGSIYGFVFDGSVDAAALSAS